MRKLTGREKWLLGLCGASIFGVANAFVARSVWNTLRTGDDRIGELRNRLADQEMWLEDAEKTDARERWLEETMPRLAGSTLGKEQGDLLQAMQDDLFERKLKIERQSLQDIVQENFYTEVAVRLIVRGDESDVVEWLTTLQNPDKFQVIKSLELEIDSRAREEEPQAVCQITIARWFVPDTGTGEPPLTKEGSREEEEEQG